MTQKQMNGRSKIKLYDEAIATRWKRGDEVGFAPTPEYD